MGPGKQKYLQHTHAVKAPQCPNRDGGGATMRADDSAAEEEVTGTAVYIVKAYLLAFGAAGK